MTQHFEELKFPKFKDALCQVWLKMAQRCLEEDDKVKSLRTVRQTDVQAIRKFA